VVGETTTENEGELRPSPTCETSGQLARIGCSWSCPRIGRTFGSCRSRWAAVGSREAPVGVSREKREA